jgi:membrane protease YdiL (CAAX protease family)
LNFLGLFPLRQSYHFLVAAWLCFTLIALDNFFLSLPQFISFIHFHWNWGGKVGEIIWSCCVVYLLKWVTPIDAGLTVPNTTDILWGIILGLIYTLFALIEMAISHQYPPNSMLTFETILFQFTLPGLAEEFFFRGVLLATLNYYFPSRWQILKVRGRVGAILVTLLFLFNHVVYFADGERSLSIHLANLSFDLIFASFCLILLREKTGSIWPGALFHNLANGLPLLLATCLRH